MQPEKTKQVAAIANQFIQHARYKLTPREQKLILYMATLLKPEDSDFETYLVPVSEIESLLKSDETKKHGSFYERLDQLLDSITDKKITFPTDFVMDGVRLRGHINWVAGAVPKYDEDGILCVEFGFSPQMKPFLLGLKEKFTRFDFIEVSKMKSGFSIRIYQMCKAYYYENIRHGRNVLAVGIRELRQRLGIGDKFTDFRNFRRKVLDVAREEINEKTRLSIEYDFIKKGRNITDMRIIINERGDFVAAEEETTTAPPTRKLKSGAPVPDANAEFQRRIEQLTEAQRRAFNTLTEYGVSIAFALDEALPIVKGSELVGYEDFFVLFMLAFFEKKTNVKTPKEKISAFQGWVVNRRFEEPNLYSQLMEQVVARKKRLNDIERDNRERAKSMTAAGFRQLLKEEKEIGRSPVPTFSVQRKTATQANKMNRVGETGDLFAPKKDTPPKPFFQFLQFQTDYPDIFKKIKKERIAAFAEFKSASNYKQLLENSVQAYCEQWFKEHAV